MLVLTRRENEYIILTLPDGNTVKIMVTKIVESKVRIGIDAPEKVVILREELI